MAWKHGLGEAPILLQGCSLLGPKALKLYTPPTDMEPLAAELVPVNLFGYLSLGRSHFGAERVIGGCTQGLQLRGSD